MIRGSFVWVLRTALGGFLRRSDRIAQSAGLLVMLLVLIAGCSRAVEVSRVAPPPPASASVLPPPPQPVAPSLPADTTRSEEVQVGPQGRVSVEDLGAKPDGVTGGEQVVGTEAGGPLKDIFFEVDDTLVRSDQQDSVRTDAVWLRAHPNVVVRVEGHCDERGSEEYNLALGQRRANAVKAALIAAGVPAERISTISYGKERPFVLGHDESQWRWNRRAHVVIGHGNVPAGSPAP